MLRIAAATATAGLLCATAHGQSFVNFETPHVHPLDLTPDGSTLLAVNTADNRLEVFSVGHGVLAHVGSVPVGLDPVSVRARSNSEAWVVNHLSDSVSIVDLAALNVAATLTAGDEPADAIFAGDPERAFVTLSQLNEVHVFDPADLTALPAILPIEGEDPRALATDGVNVYVAIHDSGNGTTALSETLVSSTANPYPGDPNPPPNSGAGFDPPLAAGLPPAPRGALIVKKMPDGSWQDDNGGDWSAAVGWDLHDHDVAIIDSATLATTYVTGLMNLNMAIAVRPGGGVTTVGTDALNHVRFEPVINGRFLRVVMGSFDPGSPALTFVDDLNPHLDYAAHSVPPATRVLGLGDPRGVVWSGDGLTGWVSGMGSNNIVKIGAAGARLATIPVSQGPTGVVLDEARGQLFALAKFAAAIDIIDTATDTVVHTAPLFDPTPAAIVAGRPHLYDTHATSGLGIVSCASCHVDGRMDQLAWDLGDPAGALKPFNQVCQGGPLCEDWHPLKGPMATQTLQGIIGSEPLHWRGDREDLPAFNAAFVSLMGADDQLTPTEMDEFLAFIELIAFPPNPFRGIDNSLPAAFPNGGDPDAGRNLYRNVRLDLNALSCNDCHAIPGGGTNGQITPAMALLAPQSMKIPQLRNLYEKTGFLTTSLANNRGFGFTHDGSTDTLIEFLRFPGFTFAAGPAGEQQRRDVEAFIMCFVTGTRAGIGVQTTVADGAAVPPDQLALLADMLTEADAGNLDLVAKGRQGGLQRGYFYTGGDTFQSDRAAETLSSATLIAAAAPGAELTFTLVPVDAGTRIGVDRDEDGFFDRDELDACSDPADADSVPGGPGLIGDLNGDNVVGIDDLLILLGDFGCTGGACAGDTDGDGDSDFDDLLAVLVNFGAMCP